MRSPSRVSAISAYRTYLETFGNLAVPRRLVLVVVWGDLAEALVNSESKENGVFLLGVGPKRLMRVQFRHSPLASLSLLPFTSCHTTDAVTRKHSNPYQDYPLDLRDVQREAHAWIAHPCAW